jgi:hypothetical protein
MRWSLVSGRFLQRSAAGDLTTGNSVPGGSYGIGSKDRIKVMKLLWDAIGTEFACGAMATS